MLVSSRCPTDVHPCERRQNIVSTYPEDHEMVCARTSRNSNAGRPSLEMRLSVSPLRARHLDGLGGYTSPGRGRRMALHHMGLAPAPIRQMPRDRRQVRGPPGSPGPQAPLLGQPPPGGSDVGEAGNFPAPEALTRRRPAVGTYPGDHAKVDAGTPARVAGIPTPGLRKCVRCEVEC